MGKSLCRSHLTLVSYVISTNSLNQAIELLPHKNTVRSSVNIVNMWHQKRVGVKMCRWVTRKWEGTCLSEGHLKMENPLSVFLPPYHTLKNISALTLQILWNNIITLINIICIGHFPHVLQPLPSRHFWFISLQIIKIPLKCLSHDTGRNAFLCLLHILLLYFLRELLLNGRSDIAQI